MNVCATKGTELRVERLKQELNELALSTKGTKNELHTRLRAELRNQGIDTDSYEFEDELAVSV